MKIQICGSMKFAQEMIKAKKELEKKGYNVTIPTDTRRHLNDSGYADNLEENLKNCIKEDTIRANFNLVSDADAILVLNYPKNGVEGYIGTSTLMEMGIAHFLKKKIFVMFDVPHFRDQRWAHEVTIISPKILGGDFSNL